MPTVFTRQLGPRSGIQLNPIKDNTERFVGSNADQIFAVAGRFERGRIDKAFRVNRSNLFRMLGQPASTQVSRLNESIVHIYDALQNGGYEAVVYRLNVAGATNLNLVCKPEAVAASVWSTSASPTGHLFYLKHLECFNDGIKAEVYAPKKLDTDNTTEIATKWVKIRLRDKKTSEILYEFEGSLDPAAVDEFGTSTYLPNTIAMQTDNVECTVASAASVPTTAAFYGKDVSGVEKWASAELTYFTESGTSYQLTDYDKACAALKYGDHEFGYIIGGGTRAVGLLSKMVALGKDINKQFVWDVPGDYAVTAAITFYEQLSIDSHYSQAYWSPLQTDDPLNGGKDYIGMSCINVGMRCARNARTDANGIPPKNYVVAGYNWPLARTGIVQKITPTEQELDDLARTRFNPVLFTRFTTGGKYVFTDSLTGAKTEGDRKLIAVADMSSHVDDWVTQFAQQCLQLPMLAAIKAMKDFLKKLFESLETAQWIKPGVDLDGKSFAYEVKENNMRPSDRMDVNYALRYDGTVRAIYVQQTLSK